MRLVEMTTTEGGTVTLPDPDPDPGDGTKECTISPVPPGPHCDGKIQTLSVRYVGGSCADSVHKQEDKFLCNGNAGLVQPVRIVCTKAGSATPVYLDSGEPASVFLDDVVDIAAANAG